MPGKLTQGMLVEQFDDIEQFEQVFPADFGNAAALIARHAEQALVDQHLDLLADRRPASRAKASSSIVNPGGSWCARIRSRTESAMPSYNAVGRIGAAGWQYHPAHRLQSATDFHFSRIGGTCPLWNVYEAFALPGRILTQTASMPDGRAYLWVARSISRNYGGYGTPGKTFAIGLGCDIRHAGHLVYSQGLNLQDSTGFTPIGAGSKVCQRDNCPQRAFPAVGSLLSADENCYRFAPYPATGNGERK